MVYCVRVLGVGLGQFAGEELRLLLKPSLFQGRNLRAGLWVRRAGYNTFVQGDLVLHMCPRLEVVRGRRAFDKGRPHWRSHEVELVHRRQTEDLLDRPRHIDLRVVSVIGVSALHGIWADDIARAAMTVDMTGFPDVRFSAALNFGKALSHIVVKGLLQFPPTRKMATGTQSDPE